MGGDTMTTEPKIVTNPQLSVKAPKIRRRWQWGAGLVAIDAVKKIIANVKRRRKP
jgi:hypothetical protein